MRFQILFTLLFASMSVASINNNNNTKISLLPYCAMRSAAVKIGQAVSPSLSAYTVCELDRLACYGVGSIRDYPSPATQTKCDSAFCRLHYDRDRTASDLYEASSVPVCFLSIAHRSQA
jgi:hypothetical protein